MSTNRSSHTEVRTEIQVHSDTGEVYSPLAESITQRVHSSGPYYVVPDGFYIPNSTGQPPGWLVNIIAAVVKQVTGADDGLLERVTEQVGELLDQLEEMKQVYEQQAQINQIIADQVAQHMQPINNQLVSLNTRLSSVESSNVSSAWVTQEVNRGVQEAADNLDNQLEGVHNAINQLQGQIGNIPLEQEFTYFDGDLNIESEGYDAEHYDDDRMQVTNESVQVYSGRQLVALFGDLEADIMEPDDFDIVDDDDDG